MSLMLLKRAGFTYSSCCFLRHLNEAHLLATPARVLLLYILLQLSTLENLLVDRHLSPIMPDHLIRHTTTTTYRLFTSRIPYSPGEINGR